VAAHTRVRAGGGWTPGRAKGPLASLKGMPEPAALGIGFCPSRRGAGALGEAARSAARQLGCNPAVTLRL